VLCILIKFVVDVASNIVRMHSKSYNSFWLPIPLTFQGLTINRHWLLMQRQEQQKLQGALVLFSLRWITKVTIKPSRLPPNRSSTAVWGMDIFNEYLKGKQFILFTDHKPLEKLGYLHTKTLIRMQAALLGHDFLVKYKRGTAMPAVYLSRLPSFPVEA